MLKTLKHLIQGIHSPKQYHRSFSLVKMSSKSDWKTEKERILNLTLEEKRNVLKSSNIKFVEWEDIPTWPKYASENNVETKKHTLDDLKEFKKLEIDQSLNKTLASKVSLYKGDITKLEVDAIVNAANSLLRAGGGVDGAIHRAAGPLLQAECLTLNGCPTGEAKITGGYNLPAKYVIHTVGPQDGNEQALRSCYKNCFALRDEYSLHTFAFPCISTGIYGFPNRLAAHIALQAARKFMEDNEKNNKLTQRIIFCTFMPIDVDIYETLMQMYFPLHEWNYNDGATVTD